MSFVKALKDKYCPAEESAKLVELVPDNIRESALYMAPGKSQLICVSEKKVLDWT